jgi:hypothetical protein
MDAMPYKDPERKKEWERLHRTERLARRRELRHAQAVEQTARTEWLGPDEAAKQLDFIPARAAWTYVKRLSSFGLLERRSRGRGTLEYRITKLGRERLHWLRSQRD